MMCGPFQPCRPMVRLGEGITDQSGINQVVAPSRNSSCVCDRELYE